MSGMNPLFKKRRNRIQDVLRTTTLREFDGGWNVIDNDLNLSPSYAKIFSNVYRNADGAVGVRWGTRFFTDLSEADDRFAVVSSISTTNLSDVVELTITGHPFISGQTVSHTINATYGGITITPGNITLTYVDADTVSFVAGSAATSDSTTSILATLIRDQDTSLYEIIYQTYFGDHIVCVVRNGDIYRVNASGNHEVIWNSEIASRLSGSPSGWTLPTTYASGAVFNNELIICNGVDKPVIINFDNTPTATVGYVQYLYDLGNPFSNTNVPIGRYVLSINRFLVIAGDPSNPDRLHISNRDSSGTWSGDAGSNGINVDLGRYVSTNEQTIRGIARFDDKLFIMFDEALLIGELGNFVSSVHEPSFESSISAFGGLSHHAAVSVGNDMFTLDYAGVSSVARALFTGAYRAERTSELISPEIQKSLAALTVGATEDQVWAVHNRKENQVMFFVPDDSTTPTETLVYVYTQPVLGRKTGSWALFRGWNFRHGCRSALDRLFFCGAGAQDGTKIYVYGTENDPIYADFVDDPDVADPTNGTAIDFIWEFPWADFDDRMAIKVLRYFNIDAEGDGAFTVSFFVDNLYTDTSGNLQPNITLDFAGQDSPGFGQGMFGQDPFGGVRSTQREDGYAIRSKFKLLKLRITGSETRKMKFVGLTFAYIKGSIRR